MSKLMRMNIIGIRSFGPEEDDIQRIKFYSPLTLIQGQNGCGKTTIIEAIKFAITGDLPGGVAKGQGFVFDPKLAKSFESRGQVKLRVSDSQGEWVTVTKTVAVIQKKDKLEFRRLDSTISRGKDEQRKSGKCVDIDSEMCLTLGVSKAILNNVIFCHQEDSNWPLDEGKKLKEKFDDIFDSAKYNKYIIAATKFIKSGMEKQKILKLEVAGLFDKKEYVERKWEMYRDKQNRLELLKTEISETNNKLLPIDKRLDEIYEIEVNYSKLCTELECKKKEISLLVQQQKEILKHIKTEFSGSDEELAEKIIKFQQDLDSYQNDIECLIAKKREIEATETTMRKQINDNQMKLGSLQTEQKLHTHRVKNRNNLIKKSITDLEAPIQFNDNEDVVIHIIAQLEDALNNKQKQFEMLEKEMESEEQLLQAREDKVREECAQLKQYNVLKMKNLTEAKDELRNIQQKLEELNSAGNQLIISDNKLKRLEKEYTSLQSLVNPESLQKEIETDRIKQKDLEQKLVVCDEEVQNLQQFTSLQTELDLKNENLIIKQNELQKLQNKHEKTFKLIFGDTIPKTDLKASIESFQKSQSKLIKDITIEINHKQREVMKLESLLNSHNDKLSEKEKELTSSQKELLKHCEGDDLQEIIERTLSKIDELQRERSTLYSSEYLFKKYIRQFESEKPCCPVCKRDTEKNYAASIISDLHKKIENVPMKLLEFDNKLVREKKNYETYLELKPVNEKYLQLKEEIPKLKVEVNKLETKFKTASEELETLRNDILKPQENEKMSQTVIGDVALMDQHQKEITQIKKEIASLSVRLPSNVSNRGLQEALAAQGSLKLDLKSCTNKIETNQNRLTQHINRLQKLKEQQNEIITQQLEIKKNMQGKDHFITKSVELEGKIVDIENEIGNIKSQLEIVQNKLELAIEEKENLKSENKSKIERSRQLLYIFQKTIHLIQEDQKGINNFIKMDISSQINSVNEKIATIQNEISIYSNKKNSIDSNINDLKTQITEGKINYRKLEDNVKLREKKKEETALNGKFKELLAKSHNNDIRKIINEKKDLISQQTSLRETIHKSEGTKAEIIKNLKEIKIELEQPTNVQVQMNYKKKFLECKLHEKAINDMKGFVKAVDWALMQFHKQRMIQVNNIIKDLWRTIYKGNDIDYIEIKTEESTEGIDKRKMYKYGIVQVKNEVELEMRGRCSAGQRVLACLIIRIALAETFSSNCGILTLDEPTTNLDKDNIISLSEALIEIIEQKKQQKNFQLVIITHDEDFVERLRKIRSMENYYVIKRNAQGKSVIIEKR